MKRCSFAHERPPGTIDRDGEVADLRTQISPLGLKASLGVTRCIDNVGTMTTMIMFDGRMWLCQHLLDAKMT